MRLPEDISARYHTLDTRAVQQKKVSGFAVAASRTYVWMRLRKNLKNLINESANIYFEVY